MTTCCLWHLRLRWECQKLRDLSGVFLLQWLLVRLFPLSLGLCLVLGSSTQLKDVLDGPRMVHSWSYLSWGEHKIILGVSRIFSKCSRISHTRLKSQLLTNHDRITAHAGSDRHDCFIKLIKIRITHLTRFGGLIILLSGRGGTASELRINALMQPHRKSPRACCQIQLWRGIRKRE